MLVSRIHILVRASVSNIGVPIPFNFLLSVVFYVSFIVYFYRSEINLSKLSYVLILTYLNHLFENKNRILDSANPCIACYVTFMLYNMEFETKKEI